MRWKGLSAITALAVVLAGIAVVQGPPAAAAAPTARGPVKATHTITLVTGDRVTLTTFTDGRQVAAIDRPDNATGGVHLHESGGDIYVLPDEALGLLAADLLDRRLFNITDLIEMGYDDAKTSGVPMIATFAKPSATTRGAVAKPVAPNGSRLVRELRSVGGAALNADKRQARTFWKTVAPSPASTTLSAGVTKLWLDGRVRVGLKESVPMVGAPEAWAAGYTGAGVTVAVLDTGVDPSHPDLAGQIDNMVSFVPDESVIDIHGHGTHVASTIAGTGTASGGDHKGVAPDADLIVGKVLGGAEGFGADSWVLAGMQWAAESGADIVNMSLGDTFATDGSDPMSMAVDALTAQYGTLFVIASGNAGPESISAPAAAASALTVGAVDKQDTLAWFTSTGPLWRSGAMKPDISAPGVDIMAARSQSSPGEGMYQGMSGTSMAAPHVAGAAAILAQQHPEWGWQRLKDALMSSSKALADWYTPYEVGTGRLDVASAVRNTVQATGSLYFGFYDWPHEPSDAPVTKPVTFHNSGAAAVTLDLSLASGGPFTLAASSVTVLAGGSATVDAVGDPTAVSSGRYTATIVGTDAATGVAVTRTSLGLIKEEERYDLKIKIFGRDGEPATSRIVLSKAGDFWPYILTVQGELTVRMPPGTYTAVTGLDVPGERPDSLGYATLVDPETILDRPREIVLDAAKARLIDVEAPQRGEVRQRKVDFRVDYGDGTSYREAAIIPVMYDDIYLSPTEPMTQGRMDALTRYRTGETMLSLKAFGLLSFPATVQPGSVLEAGTDTLRAVYAGDGADYTGIDVRGKVAVVDRTDTVSAMDRAAAAVEAGAAMLLVVNDALGNLNEWVGEVPIPVATVHRDAGRTLVLLARAGILRLTAKQVPYASYIYDLTRVYPNRVPNQTLTYKPSQRDLARIDAHYYSVNDVEGGGYRYDMTFSPSAGFGERESYPGVRTEWVTPDVTWFEYHQQGLWDDNSYHNAYTKGSRTRLNWFAPAVRPAFTRAFAVQNGRYRDFMTINVQSWSSSGNDGVEHGGNMEWGSMPTQMSLYQGDTLIDENPWNSDIQWASVPAGRLPYHLVLDTSRPAEDWRLSTRTHTEWDFYSESNEADDFVPFALLQLDYSLETDLRGNVKAGSTQQIGIKAGPQAGGSGTGNVVSVNLEVSYDDGKTWKRVTLTKAPNGWYTGKLKLANQPGGFLSVRASAATNAGWTINQEIVRAYGLH